LLEEQRQQIIDLVVANGADYHGDLTKKITHLVVYKPEGAKYKHAKLWGLRLVSVEWIYDSVERGMILDESLYNPEWPEEDRGKGAWIRRKLSPLGKRTRDNSMANVEEGKRKLRRTASTKLTSQNKKIWGDIVGGGSTVQAAMSRVWGENIKEETKQLGPVVTTQEASSPDSSSQPHIHMPIGPKGTFYGCHFYIQGFDRRKTEVLQKHLFSHGGVVSDALEDFATISSYGRYMVIPNTFLPPDIAAQSNIPSEIHTVTDWWVEQCLVTKTLIPPADYPLGRPFPKFPLERFRGLKVCSTGFEGMHLRHVSLVVALMGAKYEETFSQDVSVLICNPIRSLRREKLLSAQAWNIPVVSLDWLLVSIQLGERQPFKPYLHRLKRASESEIASGREKEIPCEHDGISGQIKVEVIQRKIKEAVRPAKTSKLDTTAFEDDAPVRVKVEEPCIPAPSTTSTEPLVEISSNSPRKPPLSPSKASISGPPIVSAAIPQETINTAISTLLAKSKSANDKPEHPDAAEGARKKRAPSRILGRAASNVSAVSCASSVDSTASTGQAVAWPSNKGSSGSGSGERRSSSFLHGTAQSEREKSAMTILDDLVANTDGYHEEEAAPPQTQMQYEDSESSEYKARVLARVKGTKYERKERAKVATIASLSSARDGARRGGRTLRERQGGGFR
jgi:DNA replication regulator DPB11